MVKVAVALVPAPVLSQLLVCHAQKKRFVCNLLELEALIELFPWHDLMICLFLRLCFQQIIAYLSSAYCPPEQL